MSAPRYVFLDPDGTFGDDWLYVVVEAPTGVFYQQQYGGTACRHGQVEGFLVPVFNPDALEAFRELFEKEFRGTGMHCRSWAEGETARLREGVADIRYWACDEQDAEEHRLRLDESRLDEADEAWVPVATPDGPGVLVWCNSD
ncbi:hypothetical protein J0910_16415 [Nocardiopsis sp. CNT-189]|uniref:DUF6210 family protein n=1 Tax=Nocardiopsis oceanisediminis TaxID=2816862 RepID=UPI003B37F765